MSISANWQLLQKQIAAAGRSDLSVIAVTKLHSAAEIRELLRCGAMLLGENRVEEAERKYIQEGLRAEFPHLKLHLIGHLQSRKAAAAVRLFDSIDSVDSCALAHRLDTLAAAAGRVLPIMLEVNVSGEAQKYGLTPEALPAAAADIVRLPHLAPYGLMCMAPLTDDQALISGVFAGLRSLRDQLCAQSDLAALRSLSMGMSHDYPLAIAEGSNFLRVGSFLFT